MLPNSSFSIFLQHRTDIGQKKGPELVCALVGFNLFGIGDWYMVFPTAMAIRYEKRLKKVTNRSETDKTA